MAHVVTREIQVSGKTDRKSFGLFSDLHIGSGFLDEKRMLRDFDEAKALDARININGDIFDGHNHKHKHHRPGGMCDRLHNSGNPFNEALDMAVEYLEPYAHLIDGIGVGNHDDNMAKWNGVDLVALLIGILNRNGANIEYMGYSGWLLYNFRHGTAEKTLKIQYHHGAGGGAPMSKGALSMSRANMWIEGADVVWRGHNHQIQTGWSAHQKLDRFHKIVHYQRLSVRSGSYLDTYRQQEDMSRGRVASYGEDWDSSPLPKGGAFVHVLYDKAQPNLDIRCQI